MLTRHVIRIRILFSLLIFVYQNYSKIVAQTVDCDQFYTLSNITYSNDVNVSVTDTIVSSAIHTNDSYVQYTAGISILLSDGFEIEIGATFCSVIEDCTDIGDSCSGGSTPTSAFYEFNSSAVTISFDGDDIIIESNGLPNHTSPYWESTHPLHIDQIVGDHLTPGTIQEESYTVIVPAAPVIASTSSATGLGPIGISVTGVPIFNDQERANEPLDVNTAGGLDYAGGHRGPGGYHYHLESADIPENTLLSHDDEDLIGIMADGFLLYGRKCNSTGDHPTDLDVSGGHTSTTQHCSSDQFYHYHIINEFYINSYIVLFGVDLQGTPNGIL